MIELKPCPLCGCTERLCYQTERELLAEDYDIEATFYGEGAVRVICSMSDGRTGCGASSGWYLTKAQAANAWNTRHERTCTCKMKKSGKLGYIVWDFSCCGEFCENTDDRGATTLQLDVCPQCGAKVVK